MSSSTSNSGLQQIEHRDPARGKPVAGSSLRGLSVTR
jgi:hypothetical protein